MLHRCWIIWISLFCYLQLQAQSVHEVIAFGDDQFSKGNYQLALKEYQRAWIFNETDSLNETLFNQISRSYHHLGNIDRALEYKVLAYKASTNQQHRVDLMLACVPYYLQKKQYYEAIRLLLGCPAYSDDTRKEKSLYLGIVYFQLEEYEKAGTYFKQLVTDTTFIHQQLSSKKLHKPNPKTARILSFILPGTGQMYAGNFGSGLNSFLLTTGIVAVGVSIYYHYSLINALLSVGAIYQRYYLGGIKNADRTAQDKLTTNRLHTLSTILEKVKAEHPAH